MYLKNPSLSDFLTEVSGEKGSDPKKKGGLIWYAHGSKTNKGMGAGVYCNGTRRKLSFSLGRYTTVFQAEVYAIKACVKENLDRNYRNRNIYILSDSQVALKALDKHQINSKLVWDCYQTLIELANHNSVQLVWVPGHEGIGGNETADQPAKIGSEHPFIGPEPACGISMGVAKKAIRDWMTLWNQVTILTPPRTRSCISFEVQDC
jgi:ribonuclease HI